jgi:hypothetical protein
MTGKRDVQKRSKAVSPKRRGPALFGWGMAREGLGVAASFAGAFVGSAVGRGIVVGSPQLVDVDPQPATPAGSALSGAAGALPGSRFTGRVKPGAVRDFLRANFKGQKPHMQVSALTGVPEGTIRNAMAWNGPSELSGPHMLRLVATFGPPFLAAVLDPAPDWVREGEP